MPCGGGTLTGPPKIHCWTWKTFQYKSSVMGILKNVSFFLFGVYSAFSLQYMGLVQEIPPTVCQVSSGTSQVPESEAAVVTFWLPGLSSWLCLRLGPHPACFPGSHFVLLLLGSSSGSCGCVLQHGELIDPVLQHGELIGLLTAGTSLLDVHSQSR